MYPVHFNLFLPQCLPATFCLHLKERLYSFGKENNNERTEEKIKGSGGQPMRWSGYRMLMRRAKTFQSYSSSCFFEGQ